MNDAWSAPAESSNSGVTGFVSGGLLAKILLGVLALREVAQLVTFAGNTTFVALDEPVGPLGDMLAVVLVLGGLGVVTGYLASLVLWCFWQYRMTSNLTVLGRTGMQFTPGWGVGWWFVPFANLVMPYRAMKELWKASTPEVSDDDWMFAAEPGWFPAWWGCWLASNILSNLALRIEWRMDAVDAAAAIDLIATPLGTVAGVLFILQVFRISQMQDALAKRLGAR